MNVTESAVSRQTLLGKTPFVALDFETTGLRPAQDEIIEIGAVKFTLDGLAESFSTFVDPRRPIPYQTTRVHGITDAMVAGKGPIDEHLEDLEAFLADGVIVAHNVKFDLGFYNAARTRWFRNPAENLYLDSCNLCRKVLPGRPSYSLQNLIREFGISPGTAHRALDDAAACAHLTLRAFQEMGAQSDWVLGKVLRIAGTKNPRK